MVAVQQPPLELKIGSVFAGHRIDALAGRGGMGVVFRATDLALDRPVALKLIAPALPQDPVFRARFEHECRPRRRSTIPTPSRCSTRARRTALLYVTMRFVEGTDLGALLAEDVAAGARARRRADRAGGRRARRGAPARPRASRRQAHQRAHRPARRRASTRSSPTSGYQQADGRRGGLTRPGFVMGTADYMAPEQARGEDVDGRADVYALALRAVQDAHRRGAVRPRQRPGEDVGAPQRPAALAARRAARSCRARSTTSCGARWPRTATSATVGRRVRARRGRRAGRRCAAAAAPAPGAMRVVVAEDSVLLRAGVVHLLEDAGFDVVGAGGRRRGAARGRARAPADVAVTDIRMPPTHTDEGLRAARTIRAELPGTGVLVLSQYVEEALRARPAGRERGGRRLPAQGPRRRPARLRRRRPPGRPGRLGARPGGRRRRCSAAAARRSRWTSSRSASATCSRGWPRATPTTRSPRSSDISDRAVERDVGTIFSKLGLPAGNEGHRRVLAVLTYLRA